MALLTFGDVPANMLDLSYFGFEGYFPDADPVLDLLTATQIRVRDRFSGATVSLTGNFVIQGGDLTGGSATGMEWRTGSGARLLELSGFNLPVASLLGDFGAVLFQGGNTIVGGSGDDILLSFPGSDLVQGAAGSDLLIAAGGHDTLVGGTGDDVLLAADPADWQATLYDVWGTLLAADGSAAVFLSPGQRFGYPALPGQLAWFRADLETLAIERLLVPFDGGDLFGAPVLSASGKVLALVGAARLAGDTTPGNPQLLVADLETGAIQVATRKPDGSLADYLPEALAIAADGQTVAFVYLDDDLALDDSNGVRDIYRWRDGLGLDRISLAATGGQADGPSWFPSLSADGTLLAFASAATNLAPESNGQPAAYVRDLLTGELSWIAPLANPGQIAFDIGASPLALSADGRKLVFVSAAATLVEGDDNGVADVFVRDLQSGLVERVSETQDGSGGSDWSGAPVISGDGRYVAFISANAWPDGLSDINASPDVFVKDLATGLLARIPVPGADGIGRGSVSRPQLSFDGSVLVFSHASNGTVLARLDTDGLHQLQGEAGDDIYVTLRHDSIEELAGGGYDIVLALQGSRYELPQQVEALVHPVPGAFTGVGNAADNRFLGSAADETWIGGAGVDVLTLAVPRAEATVSREGPALVLQHAATGQDRLLEVERVEFDDLALAFDNEGAAGQVFSLWFAALGRAPTAAQLTPWLQLADSGQSAVQVAQALLDFFDPTVAGGITDEFMVHQLWQNVTQTPITQGSLDFYLGKLQQGVFTQASLFAMAAAHELNQAQVQPLMLLGVPYSAQPWSWDPSIFDWAGPVL